MLGIGTPITRSEFISADDAPLLDSFSGAESAFSLRQLSSSYSGNAIRVRRDSDDAELDIGFSGGELDTSAIATHCGSASGFVTVIYDQSGNSNNISGHAQSAEPEIYNGSSVITLNGKPIMKIINKRVNVPWDSGRGDTLNAFFVFSKDQYGDPNYITGYAGNGFDIAYPTASTAPFGHLLQNITPAGTVDAGVQITHGDAFIHSFLTTPTVVNSFANGVGNSSSLSNTVVLNPTRDFPRHDNASGQVNLFEIVIYLSDQSANRTAIENNINSFYSIF